jgi:RNA polymerase sigma-54 factor
MALSQKLELRQSQSLVMTPQLMQAIKLLQLSNLDLAAYVEEELERNPLLERDERPDAEGADSPAAEAGADAGAADGNAPLDGAIENAGDFDTDLTNVYPDDLGPASEPRAPPLPDGESWQAAPSRQTARSEDYNLEAFVAEERTLADHLLEQLGLQAEDTALRAIGRALIDEIDEAGYMRGDLAEISARLGAPMELAERALGLIQSFEPTGVGARDLAECLCIQLRERDRLDPAMAALLDSLDLLARRDLAALRRVCGVDEEDLNEMIAEIRALNPRPGAGFGSAPVQPIIPDVLVRQGADGGWLIELNTNTLPRVLVNQSYYATVARSSRKETEKAFLSDCFQTANWLVKSLDQRAKTILKVASEIVRQQDAFLVHGVEHLRPLNLRSIASAISMHESTVSRVTSNKYIATPRGIFELKYFFTASIASAEGGEGHSAEAVRHRIKTLIEEETQDAVLSDDTIVQVLRGAGIDIARRTVAKYRESLRIPSSIQRRREKYAPLQGRNLSRSVI